MNIVFGSSGIAVADLESMRAINTEIGLEHRIHGLTGRSCSTTAKKGTSDETDGQSGDVAKIADE